MQEWCAWRYSCQQVCWGTHCIWRPAKSVVVPAVSYCHYIHERPCFSNLSSLLLESVSGGGIEWDIYVHVGGLVIHWGGSSKMAVCPSLSSSMVYCILGHCLLRWSLKSCTLTISWSQMTYVCAINELNPASELKAWWLVMIPNFPLTDQQWWGGRGDPIAAPSACSKEEAMLKAEIGIV